MRDWKRQMKSRNTLVDASPKNFDDLRSSFRFNKSNYKSNDTSKKSKQKQDDDADSDIVSPPNSKHASPFDKENNNNNKKHKYLKSNSFNSPKAAKFGQE